MPQKIAFQILGTTKLHLRSQDPGSRKFSSPVRAVQLGAKAALEEVIWPSEPPSALSAAAQAAFKQALALVQQPLSPVGESQEPAEEQMNDDSVIIIKE